MCIIAYKPVDTLFDEKDVKRMWNKNPDGAGVAVRNPKTKKVLFKKGMMNRKELLDIVSMFNKKELELVIHCRITSRGETNRKQTHPFKSQNIKSMGHINVRGDLYFMNGTIHELNVKKGYNDTMTFIEYMQLNKVKPNQELIDTIGDITGARWLCVSKEGIFYTSDFIEHDKKMYSNKNHMPTKTKSYNYDYTYDYSIGIENTYDKKLQKRIKKEGLYYELEDFIDMNCNNFNCSNCYDCILEQKSTKEIKRLLKKYSGTHTEYYLWDE